MQTASHHLDVETGPEVLGYFSDIPVNRVLSVSVRSDVIGARVRANRHGGGTEAAGDRRLSGVMGVILRL